MDNDIMTKTLSNKTGKRCFGVILLFSMVHLTGCMDLASGEQAAKKRHAKMGAFTFQTGEVYTMRGLGGIFSVGMNRLENTLEVDHKIRTSSTIWYKAHALSDYIIKHYQPNDRPGPIILIGHSLGANEQIKVARYLNKAHVPVTMLITIDAVSPVTVPPNVHYVLNLYKPGFVPMFSGLKLKADDPEQTTIDNVNVTLLNKGYINHFSIDKNREIQSIMLKKILAVLNHDEKYA